MTPNKINKIEIIIQIVKYHTPHHKKYHKDIHYV